MRSLVTLLLLAGACGDDGVHHQPDAPPAPDAPSIDAATTGPVTLTIIDDGTAVAGVKVYFQNADSSLVGMKETDAAGVATVVMDAGGYITAVDPFPNPSQTFGASTAFQLRTIAGVKPGDQLKLTNTRAPFTPVTFTLTLPVDVNANEYRIMTSCGSTSFTDPGGPGFQPTGAATLFGCGGAADFLIETFDVNGGPLGAFYHPGVVVAEGGTVLLTDAYAPVPDVEINYTNVAAAFSSVQFHNVLASAHGALLDTFGSIELSAGAGAATVKLPAVDGGISIHQSRLGSAISEHVVVDWSPATAAHAIDLANLPLPDYTTAPVFDTAIHAVTWTSAAAATQPDLAVVTLDFERTTPIQRVDWQIAAPYSGTTLTLPVLPEPIASLNPIATDAANVFRLTTAKVPGGYDAVRGTVLSTDTLTGLVAGASGRIVFEDMLAAGLLGRRPGPLPSLHPLRAAFAAFTR